MTARSDFLPLTTLALSVDLFWAIEPGWAMRAIAQLDTIDVGAHTLEYAGRMARRKRPDADASDDDDGDDYGRGPARAKDTPPYQITDGVAYLYLSGPLTKRPQSWGSGASTVLFRRLVRMASVDKAVKAIMIVVDSPGGQVAGSCDAAADVAVAAKLKPTACYCDDMCCSAAYWIVCQCAFGVFCNPTAVIGSVGTITVLQDSTAAYAERGVAQHVVATGDRKGIGIPGTPVTADHLAYVRDYLDLMNAQFTGSVQAARNLSKDDMTDVMRAGIYVGAQAVDIGLCCGVETMDAVHAMLVGADGDASARYAPLETGDPDPEPPAIDPPNRRSRGAAAGLHWPPNPMATSAAKCNEVTQKCTEVTQALPFQDAPLTCVAPAAIVPAAITKPEAPPIAPGMGDLRMKDKLVRALTMLGLQRMAVAVVAAIDDTPETMAQAMSAQVNAEVEERIAKHPLVLQCGAVGVTNASDFAAYNDMAILGRGHLAQIRTDAKGQAIRAFGGEIGPNIGAQVDHMPASQVSALFGAWQAQADASYGHGKDGSAPSRATAPTRLNESLAADGDPNAGEKTGWDALTADQKATGVKFGMTTPEKQAAFAAEVLQVAA